MSTLKDKLKKLSFFTHHPKEHESITYNNVIEEYLGKEEKWDEWFNSEYINGKWSVSNNYYDELYMDISYEEERSVFSCTVYLKKDGVYVEMSGVSITLKINDNTIGTYNTDSIGRVFIDDISPNSLKGKISATDGNITSEIYVNSSLIFTDIGDNKPSQYNKINSATLSWKNYITEDGECYLASNNGSNTFESVILPISNCPTNLAAEIDIKYQNSGSNIQPRFGFLTNSSNGSYYGVRLLHSDNILGVIQFKDGIDSGVYGHTATLNYNTWYKLKIIYKNGYFYSLLYNSNGQLNSSVGWKENITPIGIAIGLVANNNQVLFKNLKVYEVD